MINDDSDVKIFGEKIKDEKNDIADLLEQVNRQRSNGNAAKARELGEKLAMIFLDEREINAHVFSAVGKLPNDKSIMNQLHILIVFAAQWCLSRQLPVPSLSTTAVNAFYDRISDDTHDFYNELSGGPEFSFYYLAVRSNVSSAVAVGETFAMLCGKENDEYYASLGRNLYTLTVDEIGKMITKYHFVSI